MTEIEKILDYLVSFKQDIRAEVIIDDLLTNFNIDQDQILIGFEGSFNRPYRHDILSYNRVDFDLDKRQMLRFALSRDNLYHLLPEGISHMPKDDTSGRSLGDRLKNHREHKLQTESAKKFFSPFQNEIFLSGVRLENIEKELFFSFQSKKKMNFRYDFWGIPKDFPEELVAKLIPLLPYKYMFMGDLDLVTKALSYLLEEEVRFEKAQYKEYKDEDQGVLLGDVSLGLDFVTGYSFMDYSYPITIFIGPLKGNSFSEFIKDTPMSRFLAFFYEMFLPIEIDTTTSLLIEEKEEQFQLNINNEPILAYTTKI